MASLLVGNMATEERNVLLHQLTQVRNAGSELVNTVIGTDPSNDDGLLLILGTLARDNQDDIQHSIVDELLRRLNAVQGSGSGTEEIITYYALGNTGSELALNALLEGLNHGEIDVQVSAIRSLEALVCQSVTQQINLLHETTEDKILEEVVSLLIEAFDNQACIVVSDELLNVTVEIATQLENPHLYEFLIKYLKRLHTSEANLYIATIKQQYNYGHVQHELVSDTSFDSRIKRGSEWEEQNSVYDVVANYEERRRDVVTYPVYKAYIWGKTLGVSKLQMQMGAGDQLFQFCLVGLREMKNIV